MKWIESVKDIVKNKKIGKEGFLIIFFAGILLLVIAWPIQDKKVKTNSINESQLLDNKKNIISTYSNTQTIAEDTGQNYVTTTERRLEELLKTMEGVGDVKVMITLKDSGEMVVEKDEQIAKNNTTEVDSQGGSRNNNDYQSGEETIYKVDENGHNIPYIRMTKQPQINGILIAAQGGDKKSVNKNITEAIVALFGLEAHKIKVVKMISE